MTGKVEGAGPISPEESRLDQPIEMNPLIMPQRTSETMNTVQPTPIRAEAADINEIIALDMEEESAEFEEDIESPSERFSPQQPIFQERRESARLSFHERIEKQREKIKPFLKNTQAGTRKVRQQIRNIPRETVVTIKEIGEKFSKGVKWANKVMTVPEPILKAREGVNVANAFLNLILAPINLYETSRKYDILRKAEKEFNPESLENALDREMFRDIKQMLSDKDYNLNDIHKMLLEKHGVNLTKASNEYGTTIKDKHGLHKLVKKSGFQALITEQRAESATPKKSLKETVEEFRLSIIEVLNDKDIPLEDILSVMEKRGIQVEHFREMQNTSLLTELKFVTHYGSLIDDVAKDDESAQEKYAPLLIADMKDNGFAIPPNVTTIGQLQAMKLESQETAKKELANRLNEPQFQKTFDKTHENFIKRATAINQMRQRREAAVIHKKNHFDAKIDQFIEDYLSDDALNKLQEFPDQRETMIKEIQKKAAEELGVKDEFPLSIDGLKQLGKALVDNKETIVNDLAQKADTMDTSVRSGMKAVMKDKASRMRQMYKKVLIGTAVGTTVGVVLSALVITSFFVGLAGMPFIPPAVMMVIFNAAMVFGLAMTAQALLSFYRNNPNIMKEKLLLTDKKDWITSVPKDIQKWRLNKNKLGRERRMQALEFISNKTKTSSIDLKQYKDYLPKEAYQLLKKYKAGDASAAGKLDKLQAKYESEVDKIDTKIKKIDRKAKKWSQIHAKYKKKLADAGVKDMIAQYDRTAKKQHKAAFKQGFIDKVPTKKERLANNPYLMMLDEMSRVIDAANQEGGISPETAYAFERTFGVTIEKIHQRADVEGIDLKDMLELTMLNVFGKRAQEFSMRAEDILYQSKI
ncbi:MAG: hypothetical protein H7A37_06010 [Chlamydiales bacterium]|nr:hypothetical protein [Chlamydiales bacterium]